MMDPHERMSLYVAPSRIEGAGEGVFAKRTFFPGQLVSYFGGVKTYVDKFIFANMTLEQREVAGAYFLALGKMAPDWWGLEQSIVLDIPLHMRQVEQFRTTLGHKVNNGWDEEVNCEFQSVRHPVLGPIGVLDLGVNSYYKLIL